MVVNCIISNDYITAYLGGLDHELSWLDRVRFAMKQTPQGLYRDDLRQANALRNELSRFNALRNELRKFNALRRFKY